MKALGVKEHVLSAVSRDGCSWLRRARRITEASLLGVQCMRLPGQPVLCGCAWSGDSDDTCLVGAVGRRAVFRVRFPAQHWLAPTLLTCHRVPLSLSTSDGGVRSLVAYRTADGASATAVGTFDGRVAVLTRRSRPGGGRRRHAASWFKWSVVLQTAGRDGPGLRQRNITSIVAAPLACQPSPCGTAVRQEERPRLCAASTDGRVFVIWDGRRGRRTTLRLFDRSRRPSAPRPHLPGHEIWSICCAPGHRPRERHPKSARWLAAACEDGSLRIVTLFPSRSSSGRTPRPLGRQVVRMLRGPPTGAARTCVSCLPSHPAVARRLATVQLVTVGDDRILQVWTGTSPTAPWRVRSRYVMCAASSLRRPALKLWQRVRCGRAHEWLLTWPTCCEASAPPGPGTVGDPAPTGTWKRVRVARYDTLTYCASVSIDAPSRTQHSRPLPGLRFVAITSLRGSVYLASVSPRGTARVIWGCSFPAAGSLEGLSMRLSESDTSSSPRTGRLRRLRIAVCGANGVAACIDFDVAALIRTVRSTNE